MGLGEFLSGAGHAVESIAENTGGALKNTAKAVGYATKGAEWAVTHPGTVGRDVVKGAEFAGKHAVGTVEGTVKGVSFLASHPQYWGTAAKAMVVDQFTNPVNIISNVAMLGLTVATGGLGGAGFLAKAAEGAEGLGTAAKASEVASGVSRAVKVVGDLSDVSTATTMIAKGAETASALSKGGEAVSAVSKGADLARGVDTAADVSRGVDAVGGASRFQRGAQFVSDKIDTIAQLPTKLHQDAREALGLNRLTLVQRARQGMAESFLGHTGGVGAQETDSFLGHVGESLRQNIGQRIANAPGAPGLVGGGEASKFSQLNYKANQVSRLANVQNVGSNLKSKATMLEFAANPEKGAVDFAMQHTGQIADFAAKHAGDQIVSTVKNSLFGNNDKQTSTIPTAQPSVDSGVSDWQRSDTGMVATRRQSSFDTGMTTTSSSTAPSSVGPSNWYGQSGYNTGRGFQSSASQQQWGTSPWTQDPAYA